MREEATEVVEAEALTAEDGLSFFHGFPECQYKSVSYPDCISAATKFFQPSAFISRAQAAADDLLNAGL